MSDELEQPALPDSEVADNTAAEDQENDQAAQDQGDNETDSPDSQEQPEAEEDEEVEIGDKKFALPKSAAEKLKAERLMQADYTQKTQALSAKSKEVEARAEAIQREHTEKQQYIQDYAKVVAIDDQLAMYQNADWNRLFDEDPVQAMKYQQEQKALEQKRYQAIEGLTQKQQANALNEQQATAKQVQDAEAYIKREIPAWNEARTKEISEFIVSQGADPVETWKAVLKNPSLAKVLHKAALFDAMEKKAVPPKPKAQPQKAPVTRISAAGKSPAFDPDKLSPDAWAKWRNEELRKQRK